MRKRTFTRILALLLALLATVLPLAACKKEEPLEENQIALSWKRGKITSDQDKDEPNIVKEGFDGYSYSEIIHLEKAGTEVSFIDNNAEGSVDTTPAGADVYVVSHWVKQEDGSFVLDYPGDNYAGSGSAGRANEIVKFDKDKSATYTYVSSYPNEYIRLCYASGQTEENTKKFQFAKVFVKYTGAEGTLLTSRNGYTVKDLTVSRFLATTKNDQWHEELQGLRMYAMGDSYFGGSKTGIEYVWPNLLAQKYDMDFKNYGIGGSTISNKPDANLKPMCTRIQGMANTVPDIILFEGGRNDFAKKVPLGADNSTDVTTFCGAVNSCLTQLQEKYPGALIIGVTVWAHDQTISGQTQQQFGDAMMRLCAARGIPCFDATDTETTKVYMDSITFRKKYCQAVDDISHLNVDGMVLVEPAFEKFIAEAYRAHKAQ